MKNAFYSDLLDKFFMSEDELNKAEAVKLNEKIEAEKAEKEKAAEYEKLATAYEELMAYKDAYLKQYELVAELKSELMKKYGSVNITYKDGKAEAGPNKTAAVWPKTALDMFKW